LGKAKDGIGREAFGIGKVSDRIKCTKDVRRTIHQKESGAIRHKVNECQMSKLKFQIKPKCQKFWILEFDIHLAFGF
jgi:hypothetical protein